jgi:hypothetical protein
MSKEVWGRGASMLSLGCLPGTSTDRFTYVEALNSVLLRFYGDFLTCLMLREWVGKIQPGLTVHNLLDLYVQHYFLPGVGQDPF